jgi:hypothetical protein
MSHFDDGRPFTLNPERLLDIETNEELVRAARRPAPVASGKCLRKQPDRMGVPAKPNAKSGMNPIGISGMIPNTGGA